VLWARLGSKGSLENIHRYRPFSISVEPHIRLTQQAELREVNAVRWVSFSHGKGWAVGATSAALWGTSGGLGLALARSRS
jgi:hypothetical protein